LRKSAAAIALALVVLGTLGVVPAAAFPSGGAKVVIIVGATHGATATYRQRADKAYAEAIKYTSNVVKVYSPNATWSKVKSATKGASIVIYFGHGNGWPSPYSYDPKYTTKDGFGLNATAGNGDYNNKYYGEPSVSTLALAPNAVVILSNLCYASGNSEPGDPAPTTATARKRVDNYGAGFLKVADAVIADGHGSPEPYIRALFTTHATLDEVWRSAPNFHGHVQSFPSSRTPGAVASTDTDSATAGFYRSLVWRPGLTTDEVTGATYADTGVDPATLTVPGNAQVGTAGATLYGDDGSPVGTVPAGARLRALESGNAVSSGGTASVRVEGLDDPTITGWVAPADLLPRDSTPPAIWGLDTTGGVFSPNGDGRFDTAAISGRFSETVTWRARILDGDTVLKEVTGDGAAFSLSWDGTSGGSLRPDGAYTVWVEAQDAWRNGPTTRSTRIVLDTVPAEVVDTAPAADPARWFSPNGDGSRDTVSWTATTDAAGSLIVDVNDAGGTRVARSTQTSVAGANTVRWDGRGDDGKVLPDGSYTVRVTPRDVAGTNGAAVLLPVRIDTTLGSVTSSRSVFYPQDGDRLARATRLGYVLTRPATVTVSIQNAAGATVGTLLADAPLPAGAGSLVFDGRLPDGTMLPTGSYKALVTATDGTTTVDQAVAFRMAAFAIKVSDTTPKRGQTITVWVTSAEPLSATPRLAVGQPALAVWSVKLTRISTYGYRAKITLKSAGRSGTAAFKAYGYDTDGRGQSTRVTFPIH